MAQLHLYFHASSLFVHMRKQIFDHYLPSFVVKLEHIASCLYEMINGIHYTKETQYISLCSMVQCALFTAWPIENVITR